MSAGSSIIMEYDNERELVGLSYSAFNCEPNKPVINIEMAYLHEWIRSNIERFTPSD